MHWGSFKSVHSWEMMFQETTVSLRRVSWILNVSCMYYAGRQAETKRFARIPSGVKGLKDLFNLSAFCSLYIHLSAFQWLPWLFLGRIVLLIDTTDIHTIPKVEWVHIHVKGQQKEDHLRTLNTHYAWSCVTVTCTMKIHAERAFFRRSVQAALPALGDPVVAPGATPESVLTLDQWMLKCAGHQTIYIYTCVCIYVYWIYIHTYIHYIHTYIHTIALHCIPLHCIALHYITLHYIQ